MKKALYISTLAIGAFIGATALLTVSAAGTCVTPAPGWSSPTGNPPDNNVCPPINTGNVDQGKLGGLAIGAAAPTATYKLDVVGKGLFTDLGITNSLTVGGLTQLGGNVKIATGTPVAGEVLTAVDNTGTATWSPVPTSPGGGGLTDITFYIKSIQGGQGPVSCNAGDFVTGGGFNGINPPTNTYSYPSSASTWTCQNSNAATTCYAVCAHKN